MQPSDRSKGPPKMTIGPLPAPPGGAKPAPAKAQTPPPASTGAPAIGTGILGGGGLAFGPGYVPPKPKAPSQGPVFVARPAAPQPAAHEPIPMGGVMDAYAKGARKSDAWPTQTPQQPPRPAPAPQPAAARPAPPPKPPVTPEPPAAVEPVEEPGPAPAWMAAAQTRPARPNRMPLYVGGGILVLAIAVGGVMLLNRPAPEPAQTPLFSATEPTAPPTAPVAAPAAEPLRQAQEVATLEAPPVSAPEPVRTPAPARPQRTPAVRTVSTAPKPAETPPAPVQVATQPLAVPPPAPVPVVQQPAPKIVIPHIDPSAPIATSSPVDQ